MEKIKRKINFDIPEEKFLKLQEYCEHRGIKPSQFCKILLFDKIFNSGGVI